MRRIRARRIGLAGVTSHVKQGVISSLLVPDGTSDAAKSESCIEYPRALVLLVDGDCGRAGVAHDEFDEASANANALVVGIDEQGINLAIDGADEADRRVCLIDDNPALQSRQQSFDFALYRGPITRAQKAVCSVYRPSPQVEHGSHISEGRGS